MTTVATREIEVFLREGVMTVSRYASSGRAVSPDLNGKIRRYTYRRALFDTETVAHLVRRFETLNPGFTCDVLDHRGLRMEPDTLLGEVRRTYLRDAA